VFDTDGQCKGHPVCPQRFTVEQVEEENHRKPANPGSPGKGHGNGCVSI